MKIMKIFFFSVSHVLEHGWEYPRYFMPKMLIIDEFWSTEPYEIAGPVSQIHTLERVILAGDGQQLGPTAVRESRRSSGRLQLR